MNRKLIIGLIIALAAIGGGFFYFSSQNKNNVPDSELARINPADVTVSPESIDIGKVIMKAGLVIKEYEIKNSSPSLLRLKKIVTSCMCTRAQVSVGDKRTRFYGMEMAGDANPSISFDIPAGSLATLTVRFDPAAHGPAGVGVVNRSVYLTFADPVGTREVKFTGEVVLQ